MKKPIILSLSIIFSICIYAQKNTKNDTLTCKTVVPGRWAIEFDLGASINQTLKPSYRNNPIATTFNYKIFYRNFYMYIGTSMSYFTPSKDIRLYDLVINNQDEIEFMNMNMAVGYMYNFNRKWSVDGKLGINMGNLSVYYDDLLSYYTPEVSLGTIYGIGVNRFFKLKGYNYIVVSLGADYYTTDYSKISPDMNKQSINYFLTVAYKGFSKKIID